jgi:Na+/melibiose symporter-like transporter
MNELTPSTDVTILTPIIIATLIMLVTLLIKAIMGAGDFNRENSARGHELFKLFFLGPDLAILSLGLFVSSDVLNRILNGQKLTTFYSDFSGTFWKYFMVSILLLLACVALWVIHSENERTLDRVQAQETRQDRNNQIQTVTVYNIQWGVSLKKRAPFLILVLGNLCGIISIVSYAFFIFFGFVRP